jgi:carbon-monoxide dehydrogenase medium subunit
VPALLALDAELVLLNTRDERVAVEDIFEGPHRTSLGDRLIREIRLPRHAGRRVSSFAKLARSASDIALVNVAVSLELDGDVVREARIALGAVAPTPMRARHAEKILQGQSVTTGLQREVEQLVREEVHPITDWRASEAYRRRMSGVMVRRALEQIAMSCEPGAVSYEL